MWPRSTIGKTSKNVENSPCTDNILCPRCFACLTRYKKHTDNGPSFILFFEFLKKKQEKNIPHAFFGNPYFYTQNSSYFSFLLNPENKRITNLHIIIFVPEPDKQIWSYCKIVRSPRTHDYKGFRKSCG